MKKFSQDDINSGGAGFLCLVIFGLVGGSTRLASLLFVDAIKRYNVDRERASFPFILCFMTRNAIGPLVGFAVKKFGLKAVTVVGCFISAFAVGGCFFAEQIITVTILWGIVFGISLGFATLSVPHFLSLHFSKHLDKANGLALAGDSVGYLLLSLLTEYTLVKYGISGTFFIISGMMLHSVPAAFLLKIPRKSCQKTELDFPTEKKELQDIPQIFNGFNSSSSTKCITIQNVQEKSTINTLRIFLDPVYILILVIQSSMFYNYSTVFTILIDVSRDNGVSLDAEMYLFLAVSITELVGRLFLGSITDAGYLTKMNFLALCFAGMGLLYAAIVWIKGSAMILTFGFCFGLLMGGLNAVTTGTVTYYIDEEYHSMAVPSRLILYPPVSFTQAPLIGYFRDTLQSYDGLFYILIGLCWISSCLCLIIPYIIVWKKNRTK